jgi:hypothetical protein
MPYKLQKDGTKTCVVKENGSAVPGGCHASPADAKKHMAALYVAEKKESKELTPDQEELIVKELETKGYPSYVPFEIKSFAELDKWREAMDAVDEARDVTNDFQYLSWNILDDHTITDKAGALKSLADELAPRINKKIAEESSEDKSLPEKTFLEKTKEWIISTFGLVPKEPAGPNGLMLWKEADGTWLWSARYSNKFRDRDNPPEIISSQSHLNFVDKVDKGLLDYPELWLWHRPEFKWGKATWVAYDDSGFALAMGTVDKGCEPIAEAVSKLDAKSIRVSHGMPKKSIVRDPDDSSVIIEHVTAEISPLPARAAANLLTSFQILKEDDMPIPTDKKTTLVEEWGIPKEVLEKLEAQNADMAKEAKEAGIQSKETVEPQATPPVETPETPAVPPATAPVIKETEVVEPTKTSPIPSVQEIADAVSAVLNDRLTAIDQKFTTLETTIASMQGEIKALKETDETKITEKASKTPAMSLSALLSHSIRSAIGASETAVDGRSALAKSKPEEAPDPTSASGAPNLGIFVVDQIIKESEKPKAT